MVRGEALKAFLRKYGSKALEVAAENPTISGAAMGAGLNAPLGLIKDNNGETHVGREALFGAGLGATVGMPYGGRPSSLQELLDHLATKTRGTPNLKGL
jgi:hypothetical protein